jgi:hypothetical protein
MPVRCKELTARATNMAWRMPFPPSRMPASIEFSIKLFVCLSRTDGSRPDSIFKIELRYKLSDLNGPCTIIPVDGYIQSKIPLAHYIMERWFQARWSPVGGRCGRAPAYIVFCEPDPNYIRLSLCDKASHNKGGRPPKKKEVRAHGTPPEKTYARAQLRVL